MQISGSSAQILRSAVNSLISKLERKSYVVVAALTLTTLLGPNVDAQPPMRGGAAVSPQVGMRSEMTRSTGYLQILDRSKMPTNNARANSSGTLERAATPTFSLAAGTYSGTQTVTISDSTPGATIYYTTNGTYPSTSSFQYSVPITVSSSEVVVAMATAPGYLQSANTSATYLISSSNTPYIYTIGGNVTWGHDGDGGPATVAKFSNPRAAVADASGNVYVAEANVNFIRRIDGKTGIVTTIAGTGAAAHTGDGGPAKSAALWDPSSLAIDASSNLYIGETGDNVVRVINASTGNISTYAGNPNGTGSLNGPATDFKLGQIVGMTFDYAGNLLIGVSGQVYRVSTGTGTISALVSYLNIVAMSGIAADQRGNVYVSDVGYSRVSKIDINGNVTVFAGGGYTYADGIPATSAALSFPEGLVVDNNGNLYIADCFNQAIRKVDASGTITTYAGVLLNQYSAGGDGEPATSVGLSYPWGISLDASGNMYIADISSNRIRKITPAGPPPTAQAAAPTFSLSAGTYATSQTLEISSSTPGAAIYVSFEDSDPKTGMQGYHGPINLTGSAKIRAVAVAPGYLKSNVTTAVYTITMPAQSIISTVAGSHWYGFSGLGGPATSAQIGYPDMVASDANGNIYFSDSANHVVWEVAGGSGTISVVAGTGTAGFSGDGSAATSAQFNVPRGIAFDVVGNLYIADQQSDRVRRIDATTGIITTVAGGGTSSQSLGDGGLATQATLARPQAVAFDSKGNLLIADTNNGRVRKVDAKTGIISTVAGSPSPHTDSGDGGPATSANLTPAAIALDANDNLYIVDQAYERLRRVDASTGIITSIAGQGTSFLNDDGMLATDMQISPAGVALDSKGNVFFSDNSARVRKIDASTGRVTTIAGNTYFQFSGDGGAATIASVGSPWKLSFDSRGNLYVPDNGNLVVRKVSFPAPAATPVITPASGTYTGRQSISITDSTANATIYYTTDGSAPDTGSTVYNGAITVAQSETVQAIAVATGYAESAVAKATYTISYLTPSISLTSSSNPAFTQNSVMLTAVLSGTGGIPTGTVDFMDGSTKLGSGTLSAGTATYATSSLSIGSHSITAVYSGDGLFNGVTSSAVTQLIQDFTFAPPSGGSTSATISAGGTATYTLTVTPPSGNTSASAITFSVTGLPTGASATFNPATLPGGSGTTNVILSVTVPKSQAVRASSLQSRELPIALGLVLLPLVGLRRIRQTLHGKVLLLGLFMMGVLGPVAVTGCGGGGSTSSTPVSQPQTYTLTVTATAGSLTHNTTLTLTVN